MIVLIIIIMIIIIIIIIIIINFDTIKMHSTNVKKERARERETDCMISYGELESMCASSLCLPRGTVESTQDLLAKQNRIFKIFSLYNTVLSDD